MQHFTVSDPGCQVLEKAAPFPQVQSRTFGTLNEPGAWIFWTFLRQHGSFSTWRHLGQRVSSQCGKREPDRRHHLPLARRHASPETKWECSLDLRLHCSHGNEHLSKRHDVVGDGGYSQFCLATRPDLHASCGSLAVGPKPRPSAVGPRRDCGTFRLLAGVVPV